VSIAPREPPDLAEDAGGIVARRAVIRWGWRLFRREWRQQLLVLGLLTMAVAATIWGTSVVTNTQLRDPDYGTFGLIRSEAAPDLRTLTATGASATTRRTITAATAAALGLLGAILGMAGAVIAGLAWGHSSLSIMFSGVLLTDVLILLVGLPLAAAAGGWLLAGREPEVIAGQPLD
jgi:hypothetical protein